MNWIFLFFITNLLAQNESTKPTQNTKPQGLCIKLLEQKRTSLPNYFEVTPTDCIAKKFVWTSSNGFVMIRNAERTQIHNLNLTPRSNPTELRTFQDSLNAQFNKTPDLTENRNCQAFDPKNKSYIALSHLESSTPSDTVINFCKPYMGEKVNLQIKLQVGTEFRGKVILGTHTQKNGKLQILLGDKSKLQASPITEQQILESIVSQEEIDINELGLESFKQLDNGQNPDYAFLLQTLDCYSHASYPSHINFFRDESCLERKPELPIVKPPPSLPGTTKGSK